MFSNDAGGFVCNHVYYRAAHLVASAGLPTRVGFVHLPVAHEAPQLRTIIACIQQFLALH
jgi:pyrrolidone-carboxylate peptidase